jgi:hypothetical protein
MGLRPLRIEFLLMVVMYINAQGCLFPLEVLARELSCVAKVVARFVAACTFK